MPVIYSQTPYQLRYGVWLNLYLEGIDRSPLFYQTFSEYSDNLTIYQIFQNLEQVHLITIVSYPKYLDRHAWANSVDLGQVQVLLLFRDSYGKEKWCPST